MSNRKDAEEEERRYGKANVPRVFLLKNEGDDDAATLRHHFSYRILETARVYVPNPQHRDDTDIVKAMPFHLGKKKRRVETLCRVVHERGQKTKSSGAELENVVALIQKMKGR